MRSIPTGISVGDWTHEEGVHAYRRYEYEAGYTLFSPLLRTRCGDPAAVCPQHQRFSIGQSLAL